MIDRRFTVLNRFRGNPTRHDKCAVVYRAAVVLNAVIASSGLGDVT